MPGRNCDLIIQLKFWNIQDYKAKSFIQITHKMNTMLWTTNRDRMVFVRLFFFNAVKGGEDFIFYALSKQKAT